MYNHDDSESRRDTFHFVAMASRGQGRGHDFQYVGVFHIHVILKNDHTPIQIVDKVFQVVENGQRLLTQEDLQFVDNDIDTQPRNIKYSHHALPNGELVRADNPTEPVFEFTQEDLNERRILFKHIGAAFGRIMLWVSDGQYYASTELKVSSSKLNLFEQWMDTRVARYITDFDGRFSLNFSSLTKVPFLFF